MPELPEVECLRLGLLSTILGKSIDRVVPLYEGSIKTPSVKEFTTNIQGKTFGDIERQGKYLIFNMQPSAYLLIHLGMTGQLLFQDVSEPKQLHLRVIFKLKASHNELRFVDIRKFGRVALFNERQELEDYINLGPDALNGIVFENFVLTCQSKSSIKGVLLNQKKIAGIGNIYADEALFKAGIRPNRIAYTLDPKKLHSLYIAIKEVLTKGIEFGGTTFKDYLHSDGTQGENQKRLQVYGRSGESCYKCGTILRAQKIAGRTSTFCPHCQG